MLENQPADRLQKMKRAVESSMDGIALLDPSGAYYYLNEVHLKMFGYEKEEELLGKSWQTIYAPSEIDRINNEIFPKVISQKKWKGETIGKSKTGEPVYQEITLTVQEDGSIICICRDIAQRNTDQQLIQENKLRLEMALEGSGAGLWDWDIANNTVFYSSGWKKTLGYTDDEIKFDFNEWADRIHPDDMENAKAKLNAYLEGQTSTYESQFRLKHKEGHYIQLLDRGKITHFNAEGKPERMTGIAFNITQITETQHKLEVSEARWNAALEGSEFGVWEWDLEKNSLFFSAKLKELYGYGKEELDPSIEFWLSTSHPDERELYKKALEDHLAGTTPLFKIDRRVIHRDGSYRWFQSRGMVINRNAAGSPLRVVGSVVDITETKNLEKELIKAKEAAESDVKAKRRFLANISHEIRTPMHAIMGLAEQLSSTDLDEQQRQYAQVINDSSHSLLNIINDVIDISKIEDGKLKIETLDFSVREVFYSCFELFKEAARKKGLRFDIDVDEKLEKNHTGDPSRLRQVLQNIISNAVKFTESGFIEIRCWKGPEALVIFECTDTGIGMNEKMKERLFQDFSQEDDSFERKYGGSGLGLAISNELVNLMNGSIAIQSEKGKGTRVRIEIPFQPAKPLPAKQAESRVTSQDKDLTSVKLLVAEDNRFNQLLIQVMLNNHSISHDIVNNGSEAIEKIQQEHYDILLMDIQMPEMDGLEATRRIREKKGIELPIIAITANAIEEELKQYLKEGMTDYITKPFDEQMLIDKIREHIQNAKK